MKKNILAVIVLLASVGSVSAFDMGLSNPAWRIIGLGIVGVFAGMAAFKASKNAPESSRAGLAMGGTGLIALSVVGVAGMLILGGLPGIGTTTIVTTGIVSTVAQADIDAGCLSTTQPKPTLTLISEFTNAALTEATNLQRITKDANGNEVIGSWSTFTSGTQLGTAIDAFSTISIVFGISTTDETGNAYGPYVAEWQVPCSSSPVASFIGADDEDASGMTSTFLNSIGSAAAESVTAGVNTFTYIRYVPGNDQSFGNKYMDTKYPNMLVIDMNNTEWDFSTDVTATITNAPDECECLGKLERATAPAYHTSTYSGSGNFTIAWEFPAVYDGGEVRVRVNLDPDNTVTPATDGIHYYLYSGNYYIDTLTNELNLGVEDENQNLVGQSAPEITVGDFT